MAEPAGRVVAELGRPETPDEAAARKAESSRIYRSSQTFRNLIAALLVTIGVVAVVIFAVPRGEPANVARIDVPAIAQTVSDGYDRTVIVPRVPAEWRVNGAAVSGDADLAWTIVYVPGGSGFLRVSQVFDTDRTRDADIVGGATSDGVVTIDGIEWDRYEIAKPVAETSISYALATDAGTDRVLIYGATDAETAAVAASGVADQISALREEAR